MKPLFASILALLVAPVLSPADSDPAPTGFVPLFDGKTLEGWDGKPGAWEVRDGAIHCTGKSEGKNWLILRKETPGHFILRMEFKWDKGNSGVQVRSDDLGDWQVFGYQVEVAQQDVMGLWHHSLLPKDHPKKKSRHFLATAGQKTAFSEDGTKKIEMIADPEEVKANYRENEWNTLEIVAAGHTLTQSINGVVFSILTDKDKDMSRNEGVIALQDHGKGCQVAFRKIEWKQLTR